MRKLSHLMAAVGIMAAIVSCSAQPAKKGPAICAHRGFWNCADAGHAQNSIASLKLAQEFGFWGSEFDVHITADSVVVVNHAPTIGGMKINTSTYQELLKAKLPNGERIPTLDEYLEQGAKGGTKLVLELKPQANRKAATKMSELAVELLKKHNLWDPEKVMFISFDYEACKWIAKNAPGFTNQYLEGNIEPEKVHADGINGIDYHFIAFHKHPDWVERAHKLGMSVNVWTVDTQEEMKYLIGLGVDCITTNEPLLLHYLL